MKKQIINFDRSEYDNFYNNRAPIQRNALPKFSQFSYNAIFNVDKNIYIFVFGILTSFCLSLFVLLIDFSFSDFVELIVLAIGIVCSLLACYLSTRFVIMVISLQEASQTELIRDVIENKDRSATNKNLFDFNCLIYYVIDEKKSLEDLTIDEKRKLLLSLKNIKIRLVFIFILIIVSFISIFIIMLLRNLYG